MLADVPHFDVDVDLDGSAFKLELRWNERGAAWHLSIYDAGGNRLVANQRVVVGRGLLERRADARLPPGEMFALDTTGADQDPGADSLGNRVTLVYVSASDIAAIRAG